MYSYLISIRRGGYPNRGGRALRDTNWRSNQPIGEIPEGKSPPGWGNQWHTGSTSPGMSGILYE